MEHEEIALNLPRGEGVWTTVVIGCQLADCPQIGLLGARGQPTDPHILDHALL
jgi:hypothetical protein